MQPVIEPHVGGSRSRACPLSLLATVPRFKKRLEAILLIVSQVAFKIEVRQKAAGKPVVYHVLHSLGQHVAIRVSVLHRYERRRLSKPAQQQPDQKRCVGYDATTRSEMALSGHE